MKKSIKILSVIALVGMALSFSSCTKCITCQVTDPSDYSEEVCSDVDDNIEHGQNQSLCEANALSTPGDTCLCITTSYGASIW